LILITTEDFNVNSVVKGLQDKDVGAIVTFIGTVRDFTEHENHKVGVKELVYECYEDMAQKKFIEIRDYATAKYNIKDMSIVHRIGVLKPSERIVVIAVSAAHRKPAFTACEYTIEELKKIVPIWKKEITEDGEYWVGEEKKMEEGMK
jgi:molybdopterin synthase catalytic subunit